MGLLVWVGFFGVIFFFCFGLVWGFFGFFVWFGFCLVVLGFFLPEIQYLYCSTFFLLAFFLAFLLCGMKSENSFWFV